MSNIIPIGNASSDIVPLFAKDYTGYALHFQYESELYYDVRIRDTGKGFSVDFVRMPFPVPKQKEYTEKLYEPHWNHPQAYGIFRGSDVDKAPVAVLEISPDEWDERLHITNMWVDKDHRRQGLGHRLMNFAKDIASREDHRAIVVETQTCNAGAIGFYLSQGFMISGFDAFAYSNEDIERKEVRLEMLFKTPRVKSYI